MFYCLHNTVSKRYIRNIISSFDDSYQMVLIYLLTNYCSQLAVCTSAYPIHYKLALAFYTILSTRTIKVCQTPLAVNYETRSE